MPSLLHAVVALAALTLAMYVWLTLAGVIGKARGLISDEFIKNKTGTPPPGWITAAGRNFNNLLEIPILFYVLVLSHYAAGVGISDTQLLLGWLFVGSRVLHSLIHITINNIPLRFLSHRAGVVILVIMWINFATALV